MRNNILSLLVLVAVFFTACEQENILFDENSASTTLVKFESSTTNVTVLLGESKTVEVPFSVTALSDSERTFDVVMTDNSNPVAGSVSVGTATMPAGAYNSTLSITATDVGLTVGDDRVVELEFVEEGELVTDGTFTANIILVCESDIPLGDWTAPDGGTVTLTSIGDGEYEFSNFNYGYYAASNNPIRGQFGDVCNNITLQGSTEFGVQWRGSGVYDPVAGTITFPDGVEDANFNPGIFGPSLTFTKQ